MGAQRKSNLHRAKTLLKWIADFPGACKRFAKSAVWNMCARVLPAPALRWLWVTYKYALDSLDRLFAVVSLLFFSLLGLALPPFIGILSAHPDGLAAGLTADGIALAIFSVGAARAIRNSKRVREHEYALVHDARSLALTSFTYNKRVPLYRPTESLSIAEMPRSLLGYELEAKCRGGVLLAMTMDVHWFVKDVIEYDAKSSMLRRTNQLVRNAVAQHVPGIFKNLYWADLAPLEQKIEHQLENCVRANMRDLHGLLLEELTVDIKRFWNVKDSEETAREARETEVTEQVRADVAARSKIESDVALRTRARVEAEAEVRKKQGDAPRAATIGGDHPSDPKMKP